VTRGELTRELASTLGARHEARLIVEEVLGTRSASGPEPTPGEIGRARALAARCAAGEPLQYVLGHWAFRDLDLLVDARVLIPRPETEQVVEVALSELARLGGPDPLVVDAGTGSGAIALSLARDMARRQLGGQVIAVDMSVDAMDVARDNLARVRGQGGAMVPVTLVQGDWLDGLAEQWRGAVTLVVSNPPYVAACEWTGLDAAVRAEPRRALVAGEGSDGTPGLADVEAVLAQSLSVLTRPGGAVVELAPHQAEPASRLAKAMGYDEVEVRPDLALRPRALVVRLT
jgi:release factor glutamine methyltransferase